MTDGIFFHNISGGLFKIGGDAIQEMRSYVQDYCRKPEAGGVLLGRFVAGTTDVVVDQVTVPMPDDKRLRRRFYREPRNHQAVIDLRWNESRHRCNYLGGWHTHAEPVPSPSRTDTRDWRRALQRNHFDSETLYFIIVGVHEIRAWEGDRHTGEITELAPRYQRGGLGRVVYFNT